MDDFIKIALAGTSKVGAALPPSDHRADTLFEGNAASVEDELLLRAGARAVYRQAGYVANNSYAAVELAPRDAKPRGSVRLALLLENAFSADSKELLREFLQQMAAAGVLLPYGLLPRALNETDRETREQLLPVLGERGRWLSEYHPDWSWVKFGSAMLNEIDRDALARQWDEGTIVERCRVLTSMRRTDPNEARRWLEPALSKEKAEHRVRLLTVLDTGLTIADEDFLESYLDDRSSQVKAIAGNLLARLPDSQFTRRMRVRADTVLAAETKGILRKRLKLVCEPPETIDESWERDGIGAKAPSGVGKRAYWAELAISAVPSSHWSRKFEAAPDSLVDAIADDPFEDAVVRGWTNAAVRYAASDADTKAWLVPLWNYWISKLSRLKDKGRSEPYHYLAELLPTLDRVVAESALLAMIKGKGDQVEGLSLLDSLPRPWSAVFAHEYLAIVRGVLKSKIDQRNYQWVSSLSTAAKAISREAFSAALEPWQFHDDKGQPPTQWDERETERFCETIRMRQSFYAELS